MSKKTSIPRETACAFVDGQLGTEDRIEVHEAVKADPEVAAQICELRKLKELVREGYRDVPPPNAGAGAFGGRHWPGLARVAGFVLIISAGGVLGWLSHQLAENGERGTLVSDARIADIKANRQDLQKVILHLDSGDPTKMNSALTEIERIMELNGTKGSSAQLELIINGEGLDLIREETSPYASRVNLLLTRHENVSIVACRKALKAFEQREGDEARLLKGVTKAPSALDQVIMRLREGWTYIRV